MTPQTEARIRASFAAQSMMVTLGATLARISKGAVEITAPILPGSRQQQGFAHAGLTFAIGDSAAGYSALSVMPEECEVLTAEMKIHLLAPGAGERLIARGRGIRRHDDPRAGKGLTVLPAPQAVRPSGSASP